MAHGREDGRDDAGRWKRLDSIMRKAGVAVACGSLVLSSCPVTAVAEATTAITQDVEGSSGTTGTEGQSASSSQATPPEKPSGEAPGSDGSTQPSMPDGQPAGGGADTMTYDYTGTYSGSEVADGTTVTSDGETISATDTDQNALLAQNGGTLDVTNATVTKSGDDTDGDRCNFYGVNSIGLAVGENSRINVSKSTLSATSEGSNGLFATDSGTIYANDNEITTSADNSRGLDATYSGTIIANQMGITTQGDHSAGVATDRGGGNISLTNSTLSTAGSGSPLLYSTGDIEVSGVTGTATGSQIAGMEGLNTILINDSTLTSTQTDKTASDPIADGIIIYQSTSGDAESSTGEAATFQAANSTLRSAIQSGSMFYLTNTKANVVLSNATLDFDSTKANLIQAEGNDSNGWGTAGQNGATVTFTGIGEDMSGNVVADTISSVDLYLTEGSTWTGATQINENESGSTSASPISIHVDGTSTWTVTGDCTVSNLVVANGGKVVDEDGRTVTIKRGDDVVVQGDSDLTVTVTGTYSTDYDASGAGTLQTDLIDRSGFDGQYFTDTSFTMGGTQQESDGTGSFSDIASDAYYAKAVSWAKAKGVIHGVGGTTLFQPTYDISRADAVCMLYNLAVSNGNAAEDSSTATSGFSDVDANAYYASALAWAKETGVVNGYGDGTFRPEQSITREEFAAMLANYAQSVDGADVSADTSVLGSYTDASSVQDWAKGVVAWAVANGYMGNGGFLSGQTNIIRADVVGMIYNYAG